jgi:ketosteroid isomerase-like protein
VLAAALLVSGCTEAAEPDAVERAIRAYDTAWNTRDSAAVAAALAPDYVYFSSTGGVTTRDSTLAFLTSPDYRLEAAARAELRVVHESSDAAVVSSRWRGRGTWRGETFVDDQRCSLVLRRSGGRWQILSEHCTQIAAAPGTAAEPGHSTTSASGPAVLTSDAELVRDGEGGLRELRREWEFRARAVPCASLPAEARRDSQPGADVQP